MSNAFETGERVRVDMVIANGWHFKSYNRSCGAVTYVSPKGDQNAIFMDGCRHGVVACVAKY
jgi:hypothetical protein